MGIKNLLQMNNSNSVLKAFNIFSTPSPGSGCSCFTISRSGFSTELVSETGRPDVETLGLVPGLNRPELSTKNNSLELLPLGDGEEFFS